MTKKKQSTEAAVREIRRRTRRKFAPEEKVRIVLEGLRGKQSMIRSERLRRQSQASRSSHLSMPIRKSVASKLGELSLLCHFAPFDIADRAG
jgi:hypothetical protein